MSLAEPAASPGARWARVGTIATYALLGIVAFVGLNAALVSRGVVPEYDALSYTDAAMRLHLVLSGGSLELLGAGLPYTNTLDVVLLALLYNIFDYHVGVWLIHSGYVVLFAWLAHRLLGAGAALVLLACAVAHVHFLHQYVYLISEMKVGMLLALFIACLFHEEVARHRAMLFWITILLLFVRTIDILFIVPLVAVQVALRWRGRRAEALAAVKAVGLAILVLSPMLLHNGIQLVRRLAGIVASGQVENWRDMTGVYDKLGLLRAYRRDLLAYHEPLVYLFCFAIAIGLVLLVVRRSRGLGHFRDGLLGLLVVFAVLMQAQTNNVMVVYWLFILAALCLALLMRATLKPRYVVFAGLVLAALAVRQVGLGFVQHNRSIEAGRPVVEMANALARRIASVEAPVLFMNFGGVGALDPHGYEVALRRTLPVATTGSSISYRTPLEAYTSVMESANVAFIANQNFLWPAFMGVNRKTEEIAAFMAARGRSLGFERAERVLFDSDPSRYVDVYVRPTVKVRFLPDKWLGGEAPVILKGGGGTFAGLALDVDVVVPGGVTDPAFTFPFAAVLSDSEGRSLRSARVGGPGKGTLSFSLEGLAPGVYRIKFDKTFKPGGNDNRRLSVQYVDARLRSAEVEKK